MSFITLAESKLNKKGTVIVRVIKIGDLDAGSTNNQDWTKKNITVTDSSGSESLTVWNEKISKFKLLHKYEIAVYWKDDKYLNLSKFVEPKDLGIPVGDNTQSTIDTTSESEKAPTSDEFLKQKQEQIKKDKEELDKKLDGIFNEEQRKNIEKEIDIIHALELLVTNKLKTNTIDPNPQKIGMYMKLIYDKIGKLNKV